MKEMTANECELFGELMAYKAALRSAMDGHPALPFLAARFARAKEECIGVLLGEIAPDRVREVCESTMDALIAAIPRRIS